MANEILKTIQYRWKDDETLYTADVIIGDGKTTYDEDFPYDERVLFYFHDEAEFELARRVFDEGVGFFIEKVLPS